MTHRRLKVRWKKKGPHRHVAFFSGIEGETMVNNGTLVFLDGEEYAFFVAVLTAGAIALKRQITFEEVKSDDQG